jgi:hypothetical protein
MLCVAGTVSVANACLEESLPTIVPLATLGPASGAVSVGNEPHALELSDGRVAITMMGLGAVVLHDFDSGNSDTLGRRGAGPAEFGRAGLLVPWSQERFAVVDPMLRRITVFGTTGSVDTILPFPAQQATEGAIPHHRGVWLTPGGTSVRDSLPLLRLTSETTRPDTVALIGEAPRHFVSLGNVGLTIPAEYAPRDRWGILEDGRVWIARGSDNSVEWESLDGALRRGPAYHYPTIRTVTADRRRLDGLPAPTILDSVDRPIAPIKAPFQDVVAGPDGQLWFWLNQPAGYSAELYAVRDSNGPERLRVSLPGAHKLIAIGRKHMYVLGEDKSGDWVITRHLKPNDLR